MKVTAGEKLESGIDEENETKIDDVLSDESSFYGAISYSLCLTIGTLL
jgi:hypothetical protein